jgi:hypothetical protein
MMLSGLIISLFIQGFTLVPYLHAQETDQEEKTPRTGFSIGVNFWYTWWSPAWGTIRAEKLLPWWHINPKIEAGLEFGVGAEVRFGDSWTLATALNYGEYEVTIQKYFPIPIPYRQTFESKAQRFDGRTIAAYSINQYMRIITGLKYGGRLARMRYVRSYSFNAGHAGPMAGFGCTLPIVSSFSFEPVVYGTIIGGKERNRPSALAGCGLSGAFVYKTFSSRMTISVGGRYEYLKYIGDAGPYYLRDDDRIYGITITIAFIF